LETLTRLKLALVKLFIFICSAALGAWRWREAMHKDNFGSESFNQGAFGQAFLAFVMAGIPVIFFAVAAYLLLTFLLFRRGEIEDFHARQRIDALKKTLGEKPKGDEASKAEGHVFED
jgi:signal transduction histidine kinase